MFELLGHEENGIDARWYRLDSCNNETVTPRNASDPFENPIQPLSQLFLLGKVVFNNVLRACGILEVLTKGKNKGKLGICTSAWESFRDKYKLCMLRMLLEMEPVTKENFVGTRVWRVRVSSFRQGRQFRGPGRVY